jgi:AhpD family alkylhydroperoxidase
MTRASAVHEPAARISMTESAPSANEADVLAAIGRGADLNLFRLVGRHHPGLLRKFYPFGSKLLDGGALPDRLRELAILRIAHLRGCDYEWTHHAELAGSLGLTAAQIDAVRLGPQAANWSGRERAILSATDDLDRDGVISDAVWAALREELSAKQLTELPYLVGCYRMLAGVIRSLDIQLER